MSHDAFFDVLIDIFAKDIVPVEKVWGREYWIVNNDQYCMKLLEVYAGYQCSLHYHQIKNETFIVIVGQVKLEINGYSRYLVRSDQIRINQRDVHRFSSLHWALIIEISTHHDDSDSYRLEPSQKIEDFHENLSKDKESNKQ